MEIQTCLSRHYKFISAENITILSVLSDDFLHAFLEVAEQQYIYIYIYIYMYIYIYIYIERERERESIAYLKHLLLIYIK